MDSSTSVERMRVLRSAIDAVDDELRHLLASRAQHAIEIGTLKRDLGLPVRNDAREAEVHQRLCRDNPGPLANAELSAIMGRVIEACRRVQATATIACLGPAGSFSHQATLERFGEGAVLQLTSTITEVFERVARGDASHGVVPADNTRIGAVKETRAALADHPVLRVEEAVVVPVRLVLMTRPGVDRIGEIHSKAEALSQCAQTLDRDYGEARLVQSASTSAAAQHVASLPPRCGAAALASIEAARRYGLRVRSKDLVDGDSSSTVFWIIERQRG